MVRFDEVVAALHQALRDGGQIESTDDHGDDEQRRDDDICIALAGDLVMNLRRVGLDIYQKRGAKRS